MKALGYLLFITFILSNVKSDYSIKILLDFLQEKGYYNIIQEVKIIFGDNIAISVCKSFIETIHCEEVVRAYMRSRARGEEIYFPKEEDLSPEGKYILSNLRLLPKDKPLAICILNNYDDLIQNMSEKEITELIERIMKKKNS